MSDTLYKRNGRFKTSGIGLSFVRRVEEKYKTINGTDVFRQQQVNQILFIQMLYINLSSDTWNKIIILRRIVVKE